MRNDLSELRKTSCDLLVRCLNVKNLKNLAAGYLMKPWCV